MCEWTSKSQCFSIGHYEALRWRSVGRQRDVGGSREPRHALAPSTGEVGDDDLLAQVQLRLVYDLPGAQTSTPMIEGAADFDPEHRSGSGMRHGRARVEMKSAANDLGHHVRRRV